jgi:hypothetical protein
MSYAVKCPYCHELYVEKHVCNEKQKHMKALAERFAEKYPEVDVKASFTKSCKKHDTFFSSDLSCHDCDKEHTEVITRMFTGDASVEQGTSARYNNGKTQVREIDPDFIMGIGEVLTASRQKYDEGNWMKDT